MYGSQRSKLCVYILICIYINITQRSFDQRTNNIFVHYKLQLQVYSCSPVSMNCSHQTDRTICLNFKPFILFLVLQLPKRAVFQLNWLQFHRYFGISLPVMLNFCKSQVSRNCIIGNLEQSDHNSENQNLQARLICQDTYSLKPIRNAGRNGFPSHAHQHGIVPSSPFQPPGLNQFEQ